MWSYSFLIGVFIGGYTNLFSKIIISGLVLYIANPESFHISRFTPLYYRIFHFTYPYVSKIYSFSNLDYSTTSDRVTIIDSPTQSSQIKNPKTKLPPLKQLPPLRIK